MSNQQNQTKTLQALNQSVDVATIYNESEERWFKAQRRKRGILEMMIAGIPFFVAIGFISWYLSGAPHTVSVISMITTPTTVEIFGYEHIINWSVVAPIGLELGILMVAMMMAVGWKTTANKIIEIVLIVMSITINLLGSLIEVQDHPNLTDLEWIAGVIVGVMMGFVIPIMTSWTGRALVQLATGQVKFDIVDLSNKWLVEGRDFFRRELYRVALAQGATTANASKFSDRISQEYFQNVNFEDNMGTVPISVKSPEKAQLPSTTETPQHQEGQPVQPLSDKMDSFGQRGMSHKSLRMTKEFVDEWARNNENYLEDILSDSQQLGKRKTAQRIAVKMGFTPSHYKTVERALGDRLK
jgi:hypothetical protein